MVLMALTIFETKCEVSTAALPLFLPPSDLGTDHIYAPTLALSGCISGHSGREHSNILSWSGAPHAPAEGTLGAACM